MSEEQGEYLLSYQNLLSWGRKVLEKEEIADAEVDSWYLLEYVARMSRSEFFLHSAELADAEVKGKYEDVVLQRKNHIPLQHITGKQEFMGLSFYVNEHVLVPRQDTETLVELALPCVKGKRVLDMCTGSGCIAVSLMALGQPMCCTAVDKSADALMIAKKNAQCNQVDITFIEGDLFEKVTHKYDVIVSNPPYIPPKVIEKLAPEVRLHEPMMALDGGEDGLDFYRQIVEKSSAYLNENGYLFFEIGCEQGKSVMDLMKKAGFEDIVCKKDYARNDRVVYGHL